MRGTRATSRVARQTHAQPAFGRGVSSCACANQHLNTAWIWERTAEERKLRAPPRHLCLRATGLKLAWTTFCPERPSAGPERTVDRTPIRPRPLSSPGCLKSLFGVEKSRRARSCVASDYHKSGCCVTFPDFVTFLERLSNGALAELAVANSIRAPCLSMFVESISTSGSLQV